MVPDLHSSAGPCRQGRIGNMQFSLPMLATWTNALLLVAAGLVNLLATRRVREFYKHWDLLPGFYRTLGVIEITAAFCLVTPSLRVWGVALAGPIIFGSVVMLLDHSRYRDAAAAAIMMAGVFAAMFAIPRG